MTHLRYAVGRVCATVVGALLLVACGNETPSPGAASEHTPAAQAGPEERTQAGTARDAGNTPAHARRAPAGNIAGASPAGVVRDRVVEDPDRYLIGWMYHDWSGEDPGLDAVAEKRVPPPGGLHEGRAVNEFNRGEMLAQERARLESLFAAGRGIGAIVTDISSQLSDYDQGYNEFYIQAFAPGNSLRFGPSQHGEAHVQHKEIDTLFATINLVNALEACVWPVPAAEAARLIAQFESEGNRGRNVYARTRLRIVGARPPSGNRRELEARIESFTLYSTNNTLLGTFDLAH